MYGCFLPAHRKWKVPVFLKSCLSVQIGPCSCFWACCAVKMLIEDTGVFTCWNLNGFAWFCHRSTGKFKEIGFRNQYYRKFNGKMEAVKGLFCIAEVHFEICVRKMSSFVILSGFWVKWNTFLGGHACTIFLFHFQWYNIIQATLLRCFGSGNHILLTLIFS